MRVSLNISAPKFVSKARLASVSRRSTLMVVRTQYPGGILELSEESVQQALEDARTDLSQLFDTSVGITGVVSLADLDGPTVKLTLKGRFWHKRLDVIARMRVYLQERIPEILEVEIDDPTKLDDNIVD